MQFDIEDAKSTAKAIENANKAMVSIGPLEDSPSSQVTTNDALYIIEVAKLANVKHMVIFYESKGIYLGVLDGISSFLTNIFGKSKISLLELIEKFVEMNLSYTIMKVNSINEFASNNDRNLFLKMEGNTNIKDKVISANSALNSMVKRFQKLKWNALLLKFFQTFDILYTNYLILNGKLYQVLSK